MSHLGKRVYLSAPHLSGKERDYLIQALESNWITTLGPQVNAFEKELAAYIGAHEVVALSSGTAAIHLALKALGVQRGDHVLCSSLTFVGSTNPILYEGATPVFVDSDFETWNMSPQALKRALGELKKEGIRPRIAVIVNLYGQSANYNELIEICRENGIAILEDAAESLGASYAGKKSGNFGDLAILSFNGNKIITTSGGGALIARDSQTAERIRFWSTQSREPVPHYEHCEVGYNYRMSNLLAALGRGQLEVLDKRVQRRREIFSVYEEAFRENGDLKWMPEIQGGFSSRWLSVMTLPMDSTKKPAAIITALADLDIEARRVWKPMHRQPLFKNCRYYTASSSESVSDQLFETGVVLPSGTLMSAEDQERVIQGLRARLRS